MRYDENLASFLMNKNKVKLDKPRFVGAAILALSKTVMYDFHYKYMMEKYKDCKLLFTDTDSFCYSIPGVSRDDFHAEMKNSDYFDCSNYSEKSGMFSDKNEMVPGKFKDECPDPPIEEFIGLRAKMISMQKSRLLTTLTGQTIVKSLECSVLKTRWSLESLRMSALICQLKNL